MQICLAGSDYIHFPDVSCLCINDCTTSFYITMIHLLLSTLAMMGLTFLIGFFVAAVIKLIAYAADSFDFYSSHKLELSAFIAGGSIVRKWRNLSDRYRLKQKKHWGIIVKTSVVVSTVTLPVTPVIIMV